MKGITEMAQDNQPSPQFQETASSVGATYVAPSAKNPLAPGDKIGQLFTLNVTTPYILQRLTERTYFFGGGFYTTAFYVGERGVLLFDPPEGQGENVVQAIAEVTALPVTAIVYSHNHADHLLGTNAVLDAAGRVGMDNVRRIASAQTDAKMKLLKSSHPAPTEIVAWPDGAFDFEDLTIELHGFTRAAHADDASAWLLTPEKVVYSPDLVNPDFPPYRNFGEGENYVYYRPNVNQLAALDWTHLVGGHGNVGSAQDIDFYNVFLDDLEAAVGKALASTALGTGVDMATLNNHADLMAAWMDAIAEQATDELRPKYGKLYGFDVSTRANAQKVTLSMIYYR